ncbi:GNAT family N-acetyltransferase [Sinomicrobium pectinilyticum]|uniref:GNAT family N-acetyltransferase n=1 Tax=Sinomicrobium pectinilyticum TaxID=1084421 RepID=A0A3N0E5R4_SINP1|nr:GNAT family N-acetyltransferase [Sinomicrobium pectinilyticum]RNL83119.1 GNAT family N-acetyltransferase [Sinomicrobium pectinilyticum]
MKTQENIHNLTSLWKTVSTPFGMYNHEQDFDYAIVPGSDWPNRIWPNRDIPESSIKDIIRIIRSASVKLTLPYWDIYQSETPLLLESHGFTKTFEQVGMSMPLTQHLPQQNRLDIRPVSDNYEARTWAALYPNAFGYRIGEDIWEATPGKVHFYLAYYQNRPIGTAIIHYTGKVAGIHGVGILPEMRRNGFAQEIMSFALNRALDHGAESATLQASAMGKGLYLKMGFTEQFSMKNYQMP